MRQFGVQTNEIAPIFSGDEKILQSFHEQGTRTASKFGEAFSCLMQNVAWRLIAFHRVKYSTLLYYISFLSRHRNIENNTDNQCKEPMKMTKIVELGNLLGQIRSWDRQRQLKFGPNISKVKKDEEWGGCGEAGWGGREWKTSVCSIAFSSAIICSRDDHNSRWSAILSAVLRGLCFNLGICFFSLKQTKVDCFYNCHTFKRKRSLGTQNKRAVPSKISDSLS